MLHILFNVMRGESSTSRRVVHLRIFCRTGPYKSNLIFNKSNLDIYRKHFGFNCTQQHDFSSKGQIQ